MRLAVRNKRAFETPFNRYSEPAWQAIWNNKLERDAEKCKKLAARVEEISDPDVFCLALQHFVDGKFPEPKSGLPDKKASFTKQAKFQTYLKALEASHLAQPKHTAYYRNLGCTYDQFTAWLKEASEYDIANDALRFLNGRIPNFGFNAYDGYLLGEFGGANYKLEKTGRKVNRHAGDTISFDATSKKYKWSKEPGKEYTEPEMLHVLEKTYGYLPQVAKQKLDWAKQYPEDTQDTSDYSEERKLIDEIKQPHA